MRFWGLTAAALLAAAGCGSGEEQAGKQKPLGGGELTVTLPPTLPSEPASPQGEPEAGFETIAAVDTPPPAPPTPPKAAPAPKQIDLKPESQPERPAQVEVAVASAPEPAAPAEAGSAAETPPPEPAADAPAAGTRPAGASGWAGYIRKAGFPCRRVASADRVERSASPGLQYYRVECEGGGSYQATNRRGHLFFRRWRG